MKVTCVVYNLNNCARPKEAEHSLNWYPVSRALA